MQDAGDFEEGSVTPLQWVRDIEEVGETPPGTMSMRRKVVLAGLTYMMCVGIILFASSPRIVDSYNYLVETSRIDHKPVIHPRIP